MINLLSHECPAVACRHTACRHLLVLGLALGAAAISSPVLASSYLQAVADEGDHLEVQVGKARGEEEKLRKMQQPPAAPATRVAKTAAAPNAMRQFEEQLRAQLPGSYVLYVKMAAKDKETVYGEYMKAPPGGLAQFLPAVTKIIALSIDKQPGAK